MRSRHGWASVALVLLIAVAGCGGTSPSSSDGTTGGPPPGGWPQAENGQLTTKMCGLLTEADYKKYGHDLLPGDPPTLDPGGREVDCTYTLLDELTLQLQPTAEVAKKLYASQQADNQQRVKEDGLTSEFADGVVPGADQSWFNVSHLSTGNGPGDDKMHELHVRRGSFLFAITLGGLTGKNETDPKTELVGLAGLVLQRVPDLGKTDTGTAHVVHLVVTGTGGTATEIDYYDPTSTEMTKLKKPKLPWHLDLTIPSYGTQQVLIQLNVTMPVGLGVMTAATCTITVDGEQLAQDTGTGFAMCMGNYTEIKKQ